MAKTEPRAGYWIAELLDANRRVRRRTEHPLPQRPRIHIDGRAYDHVSQAKDGVWQFAPMK